MKDMASPPGWVGPTPMNRSTPSGHLRHNDEKTINPSQARVDLHDQLSQIEYLKELIKIEKRIILDDYLKENLL